MANEILPAANIPEQQVPQEVITETEVSAPEIQQETRPIYKSKDGRLFSKKQLIEAGYTPDRIQSGVDNQKLSLIGDVTHPEQEYQSEDGRKFTYKSLVDAGYDADRIENGISMGRLTPLEKKSPSLTTSASTNGLQDGESPSTTVTQVREVIEPQVGGPGPKPKKSLVDWLSSKNLPYDKASRQKMAELFGVQNYDFSSAKNDELLDNVETDYNLKANLTRLNYTNDDAGIQKFSKDFNVPYDGSLQSKKNILGVVNEKTNKIGDISDIVNYAVTFGGVDLKANPAQTIDQFNEVLNKEAQDFGLTNFNPQDAQQISSLAQKVRDKQDAISSIYNNIRYFKPINKPTTLSEALQTLGLPTDMASRAKLAKEKGIVADENEYIGTGIQNEQLLKTVSDDATRAKLAKTITDVAKNRYGFKAFNPSSEKDLMALNQKMKPDVTTITNQIKFKNAQAKDWEKNGKALGMNFEDYQRWKLNNRKFTKSMTMPQSQFDTNYGYEYSYDDKGNRVKVKIDETDQKFYDNAPEFYPTVEAELDRQKKNAEKLKVDLKTYQALQYMVMHDDFSVFEKDPQWSDLAKKNPEEFKKKVRAFVYNPTRYEAFQNAELAKEAQRQYYKQMQAQSLEQVKQLREENEKPWYSGISFLFEGGPGQIPDRANQLLGYLWNSAEKGVTNLAGSGVGIFEDVGAGVEGMIRGERVSPNRTASNWLKNNLGYYLEPGRLTAIPDLLFGFENEKDKEKLVSRTAQERFSNDFIIGASGSLLEIAPAAMATISGVPIGFGIIGYGGAMDAINSTEEGQKLPAWEKMLFATGNGLAQMAIAKIGLDKIFGGSTNKIALNTTEKIFQKAAQQNIKLTPAVFEKMAVDEANLLKNKALRVLSHAGTGAAFGASMGASDLLGKKLMNEATGKDIFKLPSFKLPSSIAEISDPKAWGEGWAEMAHHMGQGAMMGIIPGVGMEMRGKKESFLKTKVTKAETPEDIISLKNDIQEGIKQGKITELEANDYNKLIDEYTVLNQKIPKDITSTDARVKIADNLRRRAGLEMEMNDLLEKKKKEDPAFHEAIDEQIKGVQATIEKVNKDISDIYLGRTKSTITAEGQKLAETPADQVPEEMTSDIQDIAEDNGIEVKEDTKPIEVVQKLQEKIQVENPTVSESVQNTIDNYQNTITAAQERLRQNPEDETANQDIANAQRELDAIKKDPVRYFEELKDRTLDDLQKQVENGVDPEQLNIEGVSKGFDDLIKDAKKYAKENPIGEEAVSGEKVIEVKLPEIEVVKEEEITPTVTEEETVKTETKPTERVSSQDIKPNTTYEGEYKGKTAKIIVGEIAKDGMANVEITYEGGSVGGSRNITEVADLINAKVKTEEKPEVTTKELPSTEMAKEEAVENQYRGFKLFTREIAPDHYVTYGEDINGNKISTESKPGEEMMSMEKAQQLIDEQASTKKETKKEPTAETTTQAEVKPKETVVEPKTPAERKTLADKIRQAKIGKNKAYEATLGLPVAVWDSAVELVAKSIEAGTATADAIKRGLNYIEKNHRGKWDKKMFNETVIKSLGHKGIRVNGEDLITKPLVDKKSADIINGFYSPLEQGILDSKTEKTTGKEWAKKLEGVTEGDEMHFTRMSDFLSKNSNKSLTKQDLLDYMKNNRIEIVEIVKGGGEKSGEKLYQVFDENGQDAIGEYLNEEQAKAEVEENEGWTYEPIDVEQEGVETKYHSYQLPGKKTNYREVLITLPKTEVSIPKFEIGEKIKFKLHGDIFDGKIIEIDENDYYTIKHNGSDYYIKYDDILNAEKTKITEFKSSHFDEPNILAHIRMNTRVDAEGNKVLHIEEFQSDWGQEGRKQGFGDISKQVNINNTIVKLSESGKYYQLYQGERFLSDISKKEGDNMTKDDLHKSLVEEANRKIPISEKSKIAPAPFVTETTNWTKLAWKVALKEAVKEGADKITWTTGEQQNERYDLSKQVDAIMYGKREDGTYDIRIIEKGSTEPKLFKSAVAKNELESIVGKEVSKKIINNEGTDVPFKPYKKLSGVDLKVGGTGMKGFYGSVKEGKLGIVGEVVKSMIGQEPKTTNLNLNEIKLQNNKYAKDIAYAKKGQDNYRLFYDSVNKEYKAELFDKESGEGIDIIEIGEPKNIEQAINSFKRKFKDAQLADEFIDANTQYSIDITPTIKEGVEKGMSLFKEPFKKTEKPIVEAKAKSYVRDEKGNYYPLNTDLPEGFKITQNYENNEGEGVLYDQYGYKIKEGNISEIEDLLKESYPIGTAEIKNGTNLDLYSNIDKFTLKQFETILQKLDPQGDWSTMVKEVEGQPNEYKAQQLETKLLAESRNKLREYVTDMLKSDKADEYIGFDIPKDGLGKTEIPKEKIQESIKTKGEKAANTLRKAKLKLGEGGLQSNIAGLPIELYNAVVETIAKAIEGGASLAEAVSKAMKEHKLEEVKGFNKDKLSNIMSDIIEEKEIPEERILAEISDASIYSDNKKIRQSGLLKHILEAENIPEEYKENAKEKLNYEPSSQKQAQEVAKGLVDEFGETDAYSVAMGRDVHPSVRSAIFAELINRAAAEGEKATTKEGKIIAAEKWADYVEDYSKMLTEAGQFSSQAAFFYKTSPLGFILLENRSTQERFNEWTKGKNINELYNALMESEGGAELFEAKVEERRKQERAVRRMKRDKKIDDFFNSMKLKGGTYAVVIPPDVWNKAVDLLKAAVKGGDRVVDAVKQAIEYISSQIGDNWDKEKFKNDYESALNRVTEEGGKEKTEADRIKSYEDRMKELQRRMNEGDYSAEEYKSKRTLSEKEQAAKDEYERVKAEYQEARKKSPEWQKKKTQQFLDAFQKKIKGLTKEKQREIVNRSFKKLAENGALSKDEFRSIVADSMGFKDLQPEDVAKIEKLTNIINEAKTKEDEMVNNPTAQTVEAYRKSMYDAMEAEVELSNMRHREADLAGTFSSMYRGGLMSLFTLVKNPFQNYLLQAGLRFPSAFLQQMVELGFGVRPTILRSQKYYFEGLKEGKNLGLLRFRTGHAGGEYFGTTSYKSTLSPNQARADLKLWKEGKKFLTNKEVIERKIRASIFSKQQNLILKSLAFGDMPSRIASQWAKSAQIAMGELGIFEDAQIKAFIQSPEKMAYKILTERGVPAEEAAAKAAEYKERINTAGSKAVMEQENILSKTLSKLKQKTPESGGGALDVFSTITFPFTKIYGNVAWTGFKMAYPEVALFQSILQSAEAIKYFKKGDKANARKYTELAKESASQAAIGFGYRNYLAPYLYQNKLVQSSLDSDEKMRAMAGEKFYGKPNQINLGKSMGIGDFWVDLGWFGPVGVSVDIATKNHERDILRKFEGQPDYSIFDSGWWKNEVEDMTESSRELLNSVAIDNAATAYSAITDPSGNIARRYFISTANGMLNIVTGGTYTAISKAALPYEVRLKEDGFFDELKNNVKQRNILVRLATGMPPAKVSTIWGDKIEKDNSIAGMAFNLLGFSKTSPYKFGAILFDDYQRTMNDKFFPSIEDNKIVINGKEQKITQNQQDELNIYVGKNRKYLTNILISGAAPYYVAEFDFYEDEKEKPEYKNKDAAKYYDEINNSLKALANKYGVKDYDLSYSKTEEVQEKANEKDKKEIERLLDEKDKITVVRRGKKYSQLNDEQKIKALNILYDMGKEAGYNEFISKYPQYAPVKLTLKEQMLKKMGNEQRQKFKFEMQKSMKKQSLTDDQLEQLDGFDSKLPQMEEEKNENTTQEANLNLNLGHEPSETEEIPEIPLGESEEED